MWRPKEWTETRMSQIKNIGKLRGIPHKFLILIQLGFVCDLFKTQLYESGADAMLEALKQSGEYVANDGTKPYGMVLVRSLKFNERGWLVFIPDEEERK